MGMFKARKSKGGFAMAPFAVAPFAVAPFAASLLCPAWLVVRVRP